MDRARYRPAVVVWRFSESDIYMARIGELGVPIYIFPKGAAPAMKVAALRRLVEELKPEIVHSYTFYTNFAAWCSAVGTNSAVIGAVRSDFEWAKSVTGGWLGKLSARWPRVQIFNSVAAAQQALSAPLFGPRHCFVVRNGVDLERFVATPLEINQRTRILGIGSLIPIKRWHRVLLAAAELKGRGLDFLIQIAGDGYLRRELQEKVERLGLQSNVELLGNRDDIPGLLAKAAFLVHVSDAEGCPNAVMEAMACGRPVIATAVGDVPLLIDHGETGFVIKSGDHAGLVDRMIALVARPALCRDMGKAARAKAVREFGLDRLVSETLAIYQTAGRKNPS